MNSVSTRLTLLAAAAVAAVAAAPASAHHSFAMFDMAKTVEVAGVVKEFHWSNPHTFIDVTVNEGGKPVDYVMEGQQVRLMARSGYKRDSLKPGDKVLVKMHPLRNGSEPLRRGCILTRTLSPG